MSEILRAITISAGILFPVVILIIIVSMTAVRRGEASVRGGAHDVASESELHGQVHGAATPAAKKPEKPAAVAAANEISVPNILLFGLVLFGLAVLGLFAVSILGHL